MTKKSFAFSISADCDFSIDIFRKKILEIASQISDGGYLFLLTQYSSDLSPSISLESEALRSLMGTPNERNSDWIFFGNGVVRGYSPMRKNLSNCWQWLILQKTGERTLAKRYTSTTQTLNSSILPVLHPAFTRDVANNVWHLSEKVLIKRSLERFRALLTWPDEQLVHFHNNQKKSNIRFLKLDLSQDLIGVAHKSLYLWDNQDTIF